jgi:hypothetical protein
MPRLGLSATACSSVGKGLLVPWQAGARRTPKTGQSRRAPQPSWSLRSYRDCLWTTLATSLRPHTCTGVLDGLPCVQYASSALRATWWRLASCLCCAQASLAIRHSSWSPWLIPVGSLDRPGSDHTPIQVRHQTAVEPPVSSRALRVQPSSQSWHHALRMRG